MSPSDCPGTESSAADSLADGALRPAVGAGPLGAVALGADGAGPSAAETLPKLEHDARATTIMNAFVLRNVISY